MKSYLPMSTTKKIVFFTGSGISKESGIETFRDAIDGLWYQYVIEDVASIQGWRKNKELMLEFHNKRRAQLKEVYPNKAHELITLAENYMQVTVITQNVDNLHEQAGSSKILHLHGQLNKVRSTYNPDLVYDWEGDLKIGDKCEKGSQLRPHVVWFGESLDEQIYKSAIQAIKTCDLMVVIGTSLNVYPANELLEYLNYDAELYIIDPENIECLFPSKLKRKVVKHYQTKATIGMQQFFELKIKI